MDMVGGVLVDVLLTLRTLVTLLDVGRVILEPLTHGGEREIVGGEREMGGEGLIRTGEVNMRRGFLTGGTSRGRG